MRRSARLSARLMAIGLLAIGSLPAAGLPAAAQPSCDPNNGIGPDGGLPALPPPTEHDARYLDLAQSSAPVDMVIDAGIGRLYVVERGANDVVVVDARAETPTILGSAKVGDRPTALALDAAAGRLVVANGAACSVTVLDVSEPTPRVLATLPAGAGPRGVAVDPASGRVFIANFIGDAITAVDARADTPSLVGGPILTGPGNIGVLVEPTTGYLILLTADGRLRTLDATTGEPLGADIPLTDPADLTTDGSGSIYVAQLGPGSVIEVNLTSQGMQPGTAVPVTSQPFDIRYEPSLGRLVVAGRSSEVVLVDPSDLVVTSRVPSTSALAAALVDPATGRLWMLDYSYHRLWSVPLAAPMPSAGVSQ